ncbi:hypothetical protein KR044_007692, partial [Drosophila immigrans]
MGHRNFCCDGCQTHDFNGRRFHCLRCVNYDLCKECYDQNVETQEHRIEHPMQVMLDPEIHQHLPDLMLNGVMLDLMHFPNCYTCPYCGLLGHTAKELIDHVVTIHRQNDSHVVCPMCAGLPGIELVAIRNLARHLLLNHIEHANHIDPNTPPLRQVLARASRRRRRQQAQGPASQNGTNSRNSVRSNATRSRTATLAIANSDGLNCGPAPSCTHDTGNSAASTLVPEHSDADRYLLPQWMSEQSLKSETAFRYNDQRQPHVLFAEHLLLSMLCEEQLELPE